MLNLSPLAKPIKFIFFSLAKSIAKLVGHDWETSSLKPIFEIFSKIISLILQDVKINLSDRSISFFKI